jgi:hypothetical protein
LVLLRFHGINQRSTFVIDAVGENLLDGSPSQSRVFVQIPNDLAEKKILLRIPAAA